ncbi:MAG: tRNA (adenosine(37)-N6)-dimethylallyltransferase MiaA [Patescibacteria group bacterium]
MNKLLIICGPTGTGKTKLALTLAKKFNGELVNADSRQVYKGLDALTGKDRSNEVSIWLYDVAATDEVFSVSHFVRIAHHAIGDVHKRERLPIIVGGTGFYLRALTTAIDTIAIPPNPILRKTLNAKSPEALGRQLQRVDQARWGTMNESDRKNPRRLIRAIEVAMSESHVPSIRPSYDALWVGLTTFLPVLKERIAQRVSGRFDKAATEVREGLPPILGVDPLLSFVHGESTKEEALKEWAQAEYQYAKRQMTWFRKEKRIRWFDALERNLTEQVIDVVKAWYT